VINPCNLCWQRACFSLNAWHFACPTRGCANGTRMTEEEWIKRNPLPAPPKGETMQPEAETVASPGLVIPCAKPAPPLTGPQCLHLDMLNAARDGELNDDSLAMLFIHTRSELTRLWAMEAGR